MSDEGYMEDGYSIGVDGKARCREASGAYIFYTDYWKKKADRLANAFSSQWRWSSLEQIDKELATKFEEQWALFSAAMKSNDPEALKMQGQALERGHNAVCERMRTADKFDFNALGRVGKAPNHRTNPQGFKSWYKKYLCSNEWSQKRTAVVARCNNICEGCGSRPVDEVHHKTYEHVGDELLFELVGVCKICHGRIHKKAPA